MKRARVILRKARRTMRRLVHKSSAQTVAHDQTSLAHAHTNDEAINSKSNISRFFVEQRHIAWVMLIAVCVWGFYSYRSMPQRKDPDTPVKTFARPGDAAVARRQRRKDRATGDSEDRREGRAKRKRREDSVDLAHQLFSSLCRFG